MLNVTQARFVANADVQASGRVAAWNPRFSMQPEVLPLADKTPTIYLTHASAAITASTPPTAPTIIGPTHVTGTPLTRTFTIHNNSDVLVDVTNIQLRYEFDISTSVTAISPRAIDFIHTHGAYRTTLNLPAPNSVQVVNSAGDDAQVLPSAIHRYPIGETGTYTIHMRATTFTSPHPGIRRYRVFFDALQVD